LAILLQVVFKPTRIINSSYGWLGWGLTFLGFGFMMWAHQLFVKHKTPVRHSEPPTAFVREGPYQFTRNPMYVGGLVMFFGIAIIVGTWPFFVIPVTMFFILDRFFIPWEEKTMLKIFGDVYKRYMTSTRRWM